jgi:hypothetical protein
MNIIMNIADLITLTGLIIVTFSLIMYYNTNNFFI